MNIFLPEHNAITGGSRVVMVLDSAVIIRSIRFLPCSHLDALWLTSVKVCGCEYQFRNERLSEYAGAMKKGDQVLHIFGGIAQHVDLGIMNCTKEPKVIWPFLVAEPV